MKFYHDYEYPKFFEIPQLSEEKIAGWQWRCHILVNGLRGCHAV